MKVKYFDAHEKLRNYCTREGLELELVGTCTAFTLTPWVVKHHSCASLLPLCSFAEDEIICFYGGASVRRRGRNQEIYTCGADLSLISNNNNSEIEGLVELV